MVMRSFKLFLFVCFLNFSISFGYNDFESNYLIPDKKRDEMRKYIMPETHHLKPILDLIFLNKRVTLNAKTLEKAGFTSLFSQPRSFIRVVRHPWLQGYLIKLVLDSELREKHGHPEWHWFMERCRGARKIKKAIKQFHCKHFEVPSKWIYPLPLMPSPPIDGRYTQKAVVLVVEDMQIVDDKANKRAWKEEITKGHLDELYRIISHAGGSSYRAANIPFTIRGTFAFIDTEYPDHKPDYTRIKNYLTKDMERYWEALIEGYFQ